MLGMWWGVIGGEVGIHRPRGKEWDLLLKSESVACISSKDLDGVDRTGSRRLRKNAPIPNLAKHSRSYEVDGQNLGRRAWRFRDEI